MRLFATICCLLLASAVHAETHSIFVTGVAEKSMDPNMISLNVEVWSKADTAKKAQQMVGNEYQAVKKVFEQFKIKKEDIRTDSYNLNPESVYDQKTQQNKITGFHVSQNLNVTLHKTEDTGSFLDALASDSKSTDQGINISNIQWDSDKRSEVELSGLDGAIQNARLQANEMAKAAGVHIKSVLKLAHSSSLVNPPSPPRHGFMKAMVNESLAAPTEVSSGQIKVRVEVQAEYEIN